MSYEAQSEIERAVQSARWSGYSFRQFMEEARELWVASLADEARDVKKVSVGEGL